MYIDLYTDVIVLHLDFGSHFPVYVISSVPCVCVCVCVLLLFTQTGLMALELKL